MGRAVVAIGAVIILLGGTAIGYAVTRKATRGMSAMQTTAMVRAVEKLDAEIREARASVRERASTLSTIPTVRAAVATDVPTVADMLEKELQLSPKNGEILELGQIDKATSVAAPLMLQPDGAMRKSHGGKTGSYAELVGDRIVITEVATVAPSDKADKYAGYLSVTRPLALAPAIKALVDAGIAGKFIVNGTEAPIGEMPVGAVTQERQLGTQEGARIVAAEPPPHAVFPVPILVGGVGAAVIGLLLLVIGMMGKRSAAESRRFEAQQANVPLVSPSAIPSIAVAATQLSQHGVGAAGTPSQVGPAGSQQIVAANLGPGAMIGRWEVVRRLGSGGMADVYLAQARGDGGFEKLVAIKVMHAHLARTQRAVDHFLDEARLAARIHHPNVVAIQDLGKIGDDYVIVMEFVDGVDLERLLTSARAGERPVPLAVGLGILCRICDGLDAAHRATSPDGSPLGIVHRDVKTANVLVSRQGIVKVVDFGIAKAAIQVHRTVAGETKGTPSMMAPEQRVGEQVDVRADVYSAAAVGYELVTGHGVNLDLAALAHLGVDNWPHLPPPSSLRSLPGELDEILLRAMAFERDRRPADCAVFAAQCEAIIRVHNLAVTDKDIARWVESELRYLGPAFAGPPVGVSRSPVL